MKQNVRVKLSRYTRLINALIYDDESIEFEIEHDEDVSELSDDDLMRLLHERDLLFATDWNVVRDKAIEDEDVFEVLSVSSDYEYDDSLDDEESLDDEAVSDESPSFRSDQSTQGQTPTEYLEHAEDTSGIQDVRSVISRGPKMKSDDVGTTSQVMINNIPIDIALDEE
jgi:hypothetical protein